MTHNDDGASAATATSTTTFVSVPPTSSSSSSITKFFARQFSGGSGIDNDGENRILSESIIKENNNKLFAAGSDELKKWFNRRFNSVPSRQHSSNSEGGNFPDKNSSKKDNNRPPILKQKTHSELFSRMLETCINFEPAFFEVEENELFENDQAVWILGDSYNSLHDREEIKRDVRSRLWFTYRKNFAPIGGTGPTSDQGWGCMLRCGQMLLAQALIRRHLGSWWRWNPTDVKDKQYITILRMFQDKKSQMYSLHQIAQMGVSEGKRIGEWFGPNTVAHVLKKLTVYDDWSSLAVHVAMDSVVVREHVRAVCQTRPKCSRSLSGSGSPHCSRAMSSTEATVSKREPVEECAWRPLVLVVPLRLGLANLNPIYIPALKEYFMLHQCLGAIGGRPNHALYFIGSVGERLLYLDPHYCQSSVDLDAENDAASADGGEFPDSTFHCPYLLHMPMADIDPSLALAFYCHTEVEFNDLCECFNKGLLKASNPPLFELIDKPPSAWPKFVPYSGEDAPGLQDFAVVDTHFDTDEEFEILD